MSIVAAETAELPLKLAAKTSRRFILGAMSYMGRPGLIEIPIDPVRVNGIPLTPFALSPSPARAGAP